MSGKRRLHLTGVAADCRGNIMIEFALAMPVLLIMLAGLFDLGTYAYQKSAMTQGAREGAQYGVINYQDSANINTTAQNASGLSGVTATNNVFCECTAGTTVTCGTICSGGSTAKTYITVQTTKTYTSFFGAVSFSAGQSWSPPTNITASVTLLVSAP